ncbi:hypothetical protein [Cryptosporangium aurantiacum]|uniref:Uncharacterized protein n=1 Tax=Cryptosporangium aurantiacum TaxID=134849 RepID=A0A1M7JI66_9ACTN|nr:hypothetical protein [Cryptosporangium aurantiacum]SHM52655.1 hypothetical protein SAMN05443668_101806 [Cryptosporangium aurantiacum]
MVDGLATAVTVVALALAAWALIEVLRGFAPRKPLLVGVVGLEALLVVQLVVAVVKLVTDRTPDELATFLGYLIASLIILPVGYFWAWSEKNRSATAVVGVACLVIPVLVVRMNQVWSV